MSALNGVALTLYFVDLAAFAWGMMRFFRKFGGDRRAGRVGLLAMAFATWQAWSASGATPPAWGSAMAIALCLSALGLFASAVHTCSNRPLTAIFENDIPRHLVVDGPYRWVRHPFYLSYIMFWLAGMFASADPATALAPIAMAAIYIRAAKGEEAKFTRSHLARDHDAYRRVTGFMVPRWRTPPGPAIR